MKKVLKSNEKATLLENVSVWDKSKKVEESSYYWKGEPVIKKRPFPKNNKPTVIELFSGCGGTSKGFEMAGFEIVAGADIHVPSAETFHLNHKKASTILGDLKKIDAKILSELIGKNKIDVMIAGVPCQGFSLNNRKRFEEDERNYLFKEYIRFVKEINPEIVVLENVSGMRSTAKGTFVTAIEQALQDAGYPNVTHRLVNAADFGVPQTRVRLIFVATKNDITFEWPNEIRGPKVGIPHLTVGEALGDLPTLEAAEQAVEYDKDPQNEFQKLMRKNSKILTNHKAPNHPQDVIAKIASTVPGQPMYPKYKQRIRLSLDKPSPTQVSGGIRPQFQFGHPTSSRGLSIRERCRLQSFPDDFEVLGGTVQGRVQTGNAVPPLLAKAIASQIILALKKKMKATNMRIVPSQTIKESYV